MDLQAKLSTEKSLRLISTNLVEIYRRTLILLGLKKAGKTLDVTRCLQ